MPDHRLDESLLNKIAARKGKPKKYVREQISKRAAKSGASSSAVQIVMGMELGIGVAHRLRKVSSETRQEVQSLMAVNGASNRSPTPTPEVKAATRKKQAEPITAAAVRKLLRDDQLHGRCRDLLMASKHFDRVIREATTVLDDRLKKITGIKNLNPEALIGKVLNPNPDKAVIEISAERSEQEGIHSICRGIMLAFRNPAHHSLSDRFTREDALKVCGFVDSILGLISDGTVHLDRI
jgi:uncharacterized protein (TIGR02391 family)